MESERSDTAYFVCGGRVAGSVGWDALFSAQDTKTELPDCVLDDCDGMAGSGLGFVDWKNRLLVKVAMCKFKTNTFKNGKAVA